MSSNINTNNTIIKVISNLFKPNNMDSEIYHQIQPVEGRNDDVQHTQLEDDLALLENQSTQATFCDYCVKCKCVSGCTVYIVWFDW